MNKQAIRDSFDDICDKTPYYAYHYSWDGEPKVDAVYSPHVDSRFGSDCFDETGKTLNEVGKNLAKALGVSGLSNVPISQAEKIVLESKQFYKPRIETLLEKLTTQTNHA